VREVVSFSDPILKPRVESRPSEGFQLNVRKRGTEVRRAVYVVIASISRRSRSDRPLRAIEGEVRSRSPCSLEMASSASIESSITPRPNEAYDLTEQDLVDFGM